MVEEAAACTWYYRSGTDRRSGYRRHFQSAHAVDHADHSSDAGSSSHRAEKVRGEFPLFFYAAGI